MKFFYSQAWPRYRLEDRETWTSEGMIRYNSLLQLGLYCRLRANGLRSHISKCSLHHGIIVNYGGHVTSWLQCQMIKLTSGKEYIKAVPTQLALAQPPGLESFPSDPGKLEKETPSV